MDYNFQKCELVYLYKFLGSKWSMALLHTIGTVPFTYNELYKMFDKKISSILLSKRLKQMESFNIISREKINNRISYTITGSGKKLKNHLHIIKEWSLENDFALPSICKQNRCYCDEICRSKDQNCPLDTCP